jgi:hypothetical protein
MRLPFDAPVGVELNQCEINEMKLKNKAPPAVLAALVSLVLQAPAQAQVSVSGKTLPLSAAIIAAQAAVDTCKANGYDVTATVVDVSGTPQVVLRGDYAVIHTKDSSFRKAYRCCPRVL